MVLMAMKCLMTIRYSWAFGGGTHGAYDVTFIKKWVAERSDGLT